MAPFPEEHSRAAGYHGDNMAATGTMSGGSSGQVPVTPSINYRIVFKASKNVERPDGTTDMSWGETINELPKYKNDEMTYNEMAQKASSDGDVAGFLVWLKKSFGSIRQIKIYGYTSTQGYDFAAWLCYVGYDKEPLGPQGFTRRMRG